MKRFFALCSAALLFAACADTAPEPTSSTDGDGPRLRLLIHDKPTVEVDEVWVEFDGVTADHEQKGWLTVSDEVQSFDLLALQNGLVEELGFAEMPAGDYSQVRLHLTDAWVIVDGTTHPLTVPSGSQSGLKIGHEFTLPECGTLTMTLDWDAGAHLVHNRGQGYILRPVIDVESITVDETCDPCAEVEFEDPVLEQVVRNQLGKTSGPITDADAESVTSLTFHRAGVSSLEGLQCFTSLRTIQGFDNQVSDLSPLSDLTSLTVINLSANDISDLAPIQDLNLFTLFLTSNPLTSLAPLQDMTSLRLLGLIRTQTSDITPLTGLFNLHTLHLSENQVSDLSPLANLTSLRRLSLNSNQIADVGALAGLSILRDLFLDANQITDVSPLGNLTQLERLSFNDNTVSDVSPLANLTSLVDLRFGRNAVTDISALASLVNLTRFDFFVNQVTDVGALAGMTQLRWVNGAANPFSDISSLSTHTNLDIVLFPDTEISDVSPLAGKCFIGTLAVQRSNISCPDPVLASLEACGVRVDSDCN